MVFYLSTALGTTLVLLMVVQNCLLNFIVNV